MGKPMSRNLLKAGHQLVVYDIDQSAIHELASVGAQPGASPSDVAAKSEVIITMLPNSAIVKTVIM